MNSFTFYQPTEIVFGPGSLAQVGGVVGTLGRRALLVCDPFAVECGLTDRLAGVLAEADVSSVIYSQVKPNPTFTLVDAGAAIAREHDCDVVVGLGGGSSLDTAKGIAVAARHEGSIWAYAMGEKEITDATLPIVAVTTTSGTGSQCTQFSVISNPETRQKPGMGSRWIIPRVAIVDPELTHSMPPALTLATGFDVFSHAVEAYTSAVSSPTSDLFARQAIALTTAHLPEAYHNGDDLDARGGMALADTYAGIAISHAVVTLGHVIAHVIGGHFDDVAHGEALREIYREILAFNASAMPERHAWIAGQLCPGSTDVVAAYDEFFGAFPTATPLADRGVSEEQLQRIAEETFTYMKPITELNPVAAGPEDVFGILKKAVC